MRSHPTPLVLSQQQSKRNKCSKMNVLLVEEGLVHSQWKEAEAHVAGRVFADHAANKRYRFAIQKQSRIYAARSTWSNGVAYV